MQLKPVRYYRTTSGNMLIICVLMLFIVVLALWQLCSWTLLYYSRQQHIARTESETLGLAVSLNRDDRIGRTNRLIAGSRELVWRSRQLSNRCSSMARNIVPLSEMLLAEARESAQIIERSRIGLAREIYVDSAWSAKQSETATAQNQGEILRLSSLVLGSNKNVSSNIELTREPALLIADLSQGFSNAGASVYKGNINLKLPSPDNDLSFNVSSLPAYVAGWVSTPRLIKPESFSAGVTIFTHGEKNTFVDSGFVPTAVYVDFERIVNRPGEVKDIHALEAHSFALTSGSGPPP